MCTVRAVEGVCSFIAFSVVCSLNWESILLRPAVRRRGSWDCVHEVISFDGCIVCR